MPNLRSFRGAGAACAPGIYEHGPVNAVDGPVFIGSGPGPLGPSRNDFHECRRTMLSRRREILVKLTTSCHLCCLGACESRPSFAEPEVGNAALEIGRKQRKNSAKRGAVLLFLRSPNRRRTRISAPNAMPFADDLREKQQKQRLPPIYERG